MNIFAIAAASALLGGAAAFLSMQILIFAGAILMNALGLLKERRFDLGFFLVWLKSMVGIVICLIVFLLGDHIIRKIFGYTYEVLDPIIFWSVLSLLLLGFLFHVIMKVKRTYDIVSTPEFDAIHTVKMSKDGIDDYVKKNLELVQFFQQEKEK